MKWSKSLLVFYAAWFLKMLSSLILASRLDLNPPYFLSCVTLEFLMRCSAFAYSDCWWVIFLIVWIMSAFLYASIVFALCGIRWNWATKVAMVLLTTVTVVDMVASFLSDSSWRWKYLCVFLSVGLLLLCITSIWSVFFKSKTKIQAFRSN